MRHAGALPHRTRPEKCRSPLSLRRDRLREQRPSPLAAEAVEEVAALPRQAQQKAAVVVAALAAAQGDAQAPWLEEVAVAAQPLAGAWVASGESETQKTHYPKAHSGVAATVLRMSSALYRVRS